MEKKITQSPHMQRTRLNITDLEDSYIAKAKVFYTNLIHLDVSRKLIEIAKNNDIKVSIDLEPLIA